MNKKLYISLEKDQLQEHTPRLFHLSSISKEFKCVEILCPHRAFLPTPFPFLQEDLYQVHQPGNSYNFIKNQKFFSYLRYKLIKLSLQPYFCWITKMNYGYGKVGGPIMEQRTNPVVKQLDGKLKEEQQ